MQAAPLPFLQALHVEFGPVAALQEYFERTHAALASSGIDLTLSRDVTRLDRLGAEYEAAKPPRFPGMDADLAGFGPDSWLVLEGRDRDNGLAFVAAARLLRLKTNFLDELQSFRLFYWDPHGQRGSDDRVEVTAPSAARVRAYTALLGAYWVNPARRGRGLVQIFPTLCRWTCCALWDVDYTIGFLHKDHAERGLARLYREPEPEPWVRFRGRWSDDSYFVCNPRPQIEVDILLQAERAELRTRRGNEVLETKTIPSGARQGRIRRS
jgi:hypothetical protein